MEESNELYLSNKRNKKGKVRYEGSNEAHERGRGRERAFKR